jgi:hypothetical protein
MTMRRTVCLVASALIAVTAAGCVGGGAEASPTKGMGPNETPRLVSTATPDPSCINVQTNVDWWPMTIDNVAGASTDVIVGTFKSYAPTQWNTPDGKRPAGVVTDETPAHLIRHVVIDQPRAIRGKVGDAAHSRVNGGDLGCDHYIQSDSLGLTPDQRYVFFYIPVPSSEAGPPNDVWLYQAWPIGSDDIVQTGLDGDIPLAQLESKVAQTPLWTPPPTPTPTP